MEVVLPILNLHVFVVYASSVDAHRRTCFHACEGDAMRSNGFCELIGSRLCDAPSCHHFTSDVHQSIEEGACSEHYTFSPKRDAPNGLNALNITIFYNDFLHSILPNAKIWGVLQYFTPRPDELIAVALCTRTPHGRAFRAIEDTELYGGFIGHYTHHSS